MKSKKLTKVLGCLLAVALITGILVVTVGADEPTVTFVNPFGRIDPVANQPLVERLDGLAGKTIRMLRHGGATTTGGLFMDSLRTGLIAECDGEGLVFAMGILLIG